MREMRAGTQPRAGSVSPRPLPAAILIERVRRSPASPPRRHVNSVVRVQHPMTPDLEDLT